MAEREMSGKDLLEQLYRGLDLAPAVEAEMDARELRELADADHGKSTEPTTTSSPQAAAPPAETAADAAASRTTLVRSPLVVLCGIAVAGTIAAAALHESETRPAPGSSAVIAPPSPPPVVVATVDVPEETHYVVVVNPFDESEVFKFPPGTSESDARDAMAALLLQRARERGLRP
jgi:hypothetical protein